MKTLFALSAFLLASPAAFASSVPLMEVSLYSGFVPPQYAYSVKCEISSEGSLSTTHRGDSTEANTEYKKTLYTAALPNQAAVTNAIKVASRGRLVEQSGPVDGPSAQYTGILQGKVSDLHVRISGRNGGNGTIFDNSASTTRALVEFGDANCSAAQN